LLASGEASLREVAYELPKAEIFHFAGHAVVQSGRSGLLLSRGNGKTDDTVFDASAVQRLSLPDLRMVMLSACSTENGGEGQLDDFDSLARAFLAKGVPHVLASRWSVDSNSTTLLTGLFYDQVLAGTPIPQALAFAEARLRERAPHPYYWAAFDTFGQN
jgi:CHAT domain-containing protein